MQEAALATSSVTSVQQGYTSNAASQNNAFVGSTMMYPVTNMYQSQDVSVLPNQSTTNYVSNYRMFNVPPPTVPQMQCLPTVNAAHDTLQQVSHFDFGVGQRNISAPTSSHRRKSYYSFYCNLRNYLFINKFRINKKAILKIIK